MKSSITYCFKIICVGGFWTTLADFTMRAALDEAIFLCNDIKVGSHTTFRLFIFLKQLRLIE